VAVLEPPAGAAPVDRWLTRRWAGREAALWAPHPAHLVTDDGPVYVDHAPAGARLEIVQVCRTGPLTADLRVLARPVTAPELHLVVPWHGLDTDPPDADRHAARATRARLRAPA